MGFTGKNPYATSYTTWPHQAAGGGALVYQMLLAGSPTISGEHRVFIC